MRKIYLNSGSHSICPPETTAAVTHYQREYEQNPTQGLLAAWPRLWQSQIALAGLLNADPHDLALRTNVTHAMNDFILGVSLAPGSEILASDLEYGAVANACRYRAERDGLSMRKFHVPLNLHGQHLTEIVTQALSPKTAMVVLSHVLTGTGHVLPITEIARETSKRGILLAIDGAHAVGALALDFATLSDVDFYGGNLHKWLLGPKGTGFSWFNKNVQSRVNPILAGWATFEPPEFYGDFADKVRFTQKFGLTGCYDFAPFFAIIDTIRYWNHIDGNTIRNQIISLQNVIEDAMESTEWRRLSPPRGPTRGPLLSYELPEVFQKMSNQKILMDIWEKKKVQVNVPVVHGRCALRLSPHIYNTDDELYEAIDRITCLFKQYL
jgi:isopenicillin-N epimerase